MHARRPMKADAYRTLTSLGYTDAEAQRIRPWYPQHFEVFHSALPRTNNDFWNAYRAVKDSMNYKTSRFSFTIENPSSSNEFRFGHAEHICYESPTLTTKFLSIEFVRHFGNGLWSNNSLYQSGPRTYAYHCDSLKIKRRDLEMELMKVETPQHQSGVMRPITRSLLTSSGIGPLELPTDEKAATAVDVLRVWLAGAAVMHTTLTTYYARIGDQPRLYITPYQPLNYAYIAEFVEWNIRHEIKNAPSIMNHVRHVLTTVSHTGHGGVTLAQYVGFEDGRCIDVSGNVSMNLLRPVRADGFMPSCFSIGEKHPTQPILTLPSHLYDWFPVEEWAQAVKAVLVKA